jgi:NADPH:quinone reductase-like Zn-dependent oxidoreductase
MKAIVYYRFGSPEVLQLVEIDKPSPGEDQVLVKVRAASLNPADKHLMKGVPYLVRKAFKISIPTKEQPGRPGRDVAGVVEAVGKSVSQFKPGDEVFGHCVGSCAEYVCGSESKFVSKPAGVTFEEAASAPVAAFTALQGLRDKGQVQPGQSVLINGAAGGVGTFAVQIAKELGAEVTGVCSSRNVDLVRSIGADHVVDYTKEDFTKSGKRYDLVLDCIVNRSLAEIRRILTPTGACVLIGGPESKGAAGFFTHLLKATVVSKFSKQKFVFFMANVNQEDLATAGELMASGQVKPVIDKLYPLSETADAMRYLAERHARGKVIITVD